MCEASSRCRVVLTSCDHGRAPSASSLGSVLQRPDFSGPTRQRPRVRCEPEKERAAAEAARDGKGSPGKNRSGQPGPLCHPISLDGVTAVPANTAKSMVMAKN
jgi:hypothetical protein